MRNFFDGALGLAMVVVVLGFGLLTLAVGWAGIEHQFGFWWGVAAVALALVFRFTLPLTYGVFVCAHEIWGWHWAFALALALPGIALMLPGLFAAAFGAMRKSK